jgi:molybdate transport system substrate-binding protein
MDKFYTTLRALILMSILSLAPFALGAEVHIAVAANFKPTAIAINRLFEVKTGHKTLLSSASTGVLHSQITHGAPFDIFLSADIQAPTELEVAGYSKPGQRFCYALGRLTLVGGDGSLVDIGNAELSLAIANPRTAPYGRAGEEVLARPEYAAAGNRKVVRASNVAQAYQYWHTGSVDLALVAQSLVPEAGTQIPKHWYQPIEQQAVLLSRTPANPAAENYMDFLKSAQVKALIEDAGYGSCQ